MDWMLLSLNFTHVLAFTATVLTLLIVWYIIQPLSHWRRKGIPHVPAIPILGSLAASFLQKKSIAEDFQRIYHMTEGNRYAGFQKLLTPSIIVRDPELIKEVLVREFSSFHDNDFDLTPEMDPIMGRNIFFLHGDIWRRVRSSLTPAFSSGRIKSIMPLILEVCEDLQGFLTEEGDNEVELKELCARFTTNVVATCAFGIKTDCLRRPDEEFRKMGYKMLEPTMARGLAQLMILNAPTLSNILNIQFIPKYTADFFREVVRDVIRARNKSGEIRNDFLNMLLNLKNAGKLGVKADAAVTEIHDSKDHTQPIKDGKKINFEKILADPESLNDVAAQALGFFLDGYETSSTLISFTLFELAHNQSVQEKLKEEVEEVKANHEGNISYETIQEMHYLDMVIQESLRKFPPVPFLTRRCTKRYRFPPPEENTPKESGGLWVEPNTPIVVPIYALHHDRKHFPDPDLFNPERFSKEERREGGGINFLPFGDGPRMCIGNRFGLAQTKAAIVHVVSHFNLKPCLEKTSLPIQFDPTSVLLLSKNKLWVRIEKRGES